jgi:hypothetical protein
LVLKVETYLVAAIDVLPKFDEILISHFELKTEACVEVGSV